MTMTTSMLQHQANLQGQATTENAAGRELIFNDCYSGDVHKQW